MAIAEARQSVRGPGKQEIYRYSQASAATMPQTCSTPGKRVEKLLFITVTFSAVGGTDSDITVTLNSGVDSDYDTLLRAIDFDPTIDTDVAWFPEDEVKILPGDALDVYAPTAADGETSQVVIYTEAI